MNFIQIDSQDPSSLQSTPTKKKNSKSEINSPSKNEEILNQSPIVTKILTENNADLNPINASSQKKRKPAESISENLVIADDIHAIVKKKKSLLSSISSVSPLHETKSTSDLTIHSSNTTPPFENNQEMNQTECKKIDISSLDNINETKKESKNPNITVDILTSR